MGNDRVRDGAAAVAGDGDVELDVEVAPGALAELDVPSQPFLAGQLAGLDGGGDGAQRALPDEVAQSERVLTTRARVVHGAKLSLAWFAPATIRSRCGHRFGYLSSPSTRRQTALPFDRPTRDLLVELGTAMAVAGRDTDPDSSIPAGFTYVGQFVDHDVTFDVSSSLETATDARTIHNMRSPTLDLDSVYGRGPALDPFLYVPPPPGVPTAFRLRLGTNTPAGVGGPGGPGGADDMVEHTDWDVPRMPAPGHTAVIGDPRNDENLVVVQLHHAMLRFHNAVVDRLERDGFGGDLFVEARRIVTHHYQWAVVHDYLATVCGRAPVRDALGSVRPPVGGRFRMPVELSVAAYRFGHSMVRPAYWVNFNFVDATLADLFERSREPNLPVQSNWVVDLNAFLDTGVPVPVFNRARRIDTALTDGLASLPGFTGLMAALASRNLLRGLALGLPSGQGMAAELGVTPLTEAELLDGLPPEEAAALAGGGGVLLERTPLWYYVLREASVREGGDRLGPVGATIVAETFVRMLRRDPDSFLNATPAFTPSLAPGGAGRFTFADLVEFAGVTSP